MPGVYLSYPFCAQKCTYCNFASGVQPALERDYVDALIAEIAAHTWAWTPETVYLGGGTPSRLDAAELTRILSAVPGAPWREATMEAAPGGITRELAEAWRGAGITRVSLGVQSFAERELRQTGRKHTAADVAREVDVLRAAGISEINIDLIAGLPHQTAESWAESLAWVRRLAPPHVSVYLLEVDEDSRLGLEIIGQGARLGAAAVPDEEAMASFYEEAVDELAAQGIARYEISNFARPGHESRHNLKYWQREPYAGFGSDAHGFDGAWRTQNVELPADYVARWREAQSPVAERTEARADERFFVGLRLDAGVELTEADWRAHAAAIERGIAAGALERVGPRLRLTRRGVLVSNEILQEFLTTP
ncbi:MAG: radical SAM family heme chaperone HemW [Bryobacterales bacterium]|nr:radical SAM family heme chaperone HemW [Bryobacterales bacterium]